MQPPSDPSAAHAPTTRLWVGICVILFGILAALDNLLPSHGFILRLWPLLLVFIGVSKLNRTGRNGERPLSAYGLILAGVLVLCGNFGGSDAVWPLFLVALGVFMVTRALRRHRGVPPDLAGHQGFISASAILGGTKRHPATQDFKGGEMTAIFGGFELDLRQAIPEGNQARVDVFVLFGGGEIRVPQGWTIHMKASAIAGSLEDRTLHLPAGSVPGYEPPTLIVTGMALFGSLEVTN